MKTELDWKQDLTEYIQYMKKIQDEILRLCGIPKELMEEKGYERQNQGMY